MLILLVVVIGNKEEEAKLIVLSNYAYAISIYCDRIFFRCLTCLMYSGYSPKTREKKRWPIIFSLLMYSTIPNASFLFWRVFANTFTIEGQPIGFFKALVFFSWRRVIKRSCLYVSVSHYFTSVQCVSFIWTLAVIELNLILIITNAERSAHANSQLADLDCNAILKESSITINTANNNNDDKTKK